ARLLVGRRRRRRRQRRAAGGRPLQPRRAADGPALRARNPDPDRRDLDLRDSKNPAGRPGRSGRGTQVAPAGEPLQNGGDSMTQSKSVRSLALLLLALLGAAAPPAANPPIRLHPDNPHYFEFRGQPTVLVTSGEHYGAVMNLDFDHATYLNRLQAEGL